MGVMKMDIKLRNKESEWFEKEIKELTRLIYIPKLIFLKLELKNNDEVAVEIKSKKQFIKYPTRVTKGVTNFSTFFSFNLPIKF